MISKFCRDCTYLLGNRNSPEKKENWRCTHPSNIQSSDNDPVTGDRITTYIKEDLYSIRSSTDTCDAEGNCNWFILYEKPSYVNPPASPAQIQSSMNTNPSPITSSNIRARLKNIKVNLGDL
jgi:hypothetical protein